MNGQLRCHFSLDTFELFAPFGVDQRHHHFQLRITGTKQLGGLQEVGAQHLDLRTTAPR
ncbi:hypothetical protein D3C79_946870 [compost metagenome]